MIPVMMGYSVLKNWKVMVGGAIALAFLTLIGLSYYHYTSLLTEVSDLQVKNSQYETKTALQQAEIDAQNSALQAWVAAQKDLQEKLEQLKLVAEDAQKEGKRLNGIFGKHEFGELAKKKPSLIQNRVNRGTAASFKLLECETGNGSACQKDSTSKD